MDIDSLNSEQSPLSLLLDHSQVVLVRSLYETNIGASSRSMANMKFQQMILIAPQTEIGFPAQQAAATGQAALAGRQTFSSLEEYNVKHPGYIRIGFSARDGRGRETRDLSEVLNRITQMPDVLSDAPGFQFVFGPENAGLTTDELSLCHYCARIPTYGDNPSLNLAQAVLLALFMMRQWAGTTQLTRLDGQKHWTRPERTQLQFEFPDELLKEWLSAQGFNLSNRNHSAYTLLRRMFLRAVPQPKENEILHAALWQSLRKMLVSPTDNSKSEDEST